MQHQAPATPPPVSSTPAPVNNADDAALFADGETAGDAVLKEAPARDGTDEEGGPAPGNVSAPTPPGDDANADPADTGDTAVEAGAGADNDDDDDDDATQADGTNAAPILSGPSEDDVRAETRAERGADDIEAVGDRTTPE
jgi:hypothetical protein